MLSFCLRDPFVESKLQQYNETLTSKKYKKYLTGSKYYDAIENVDFNDVTVDLSEYVYSDKIVFNNGTTIKRMYPNKVFEQPILTYAVDIWDTDSIYKCFGLRMQKKNIVAGYFAFNKSLFGGRRQTYSMLGQEL